MSLGYRHSLFLASNGDVYGAGLNRNYQLGLGNTHSLLNYNTPVHIDALDGQKVLKIEAGGFSAAITMQSEILIWGEGEFGVFHLPQRLYMDQCDFIDCKINKFRSNSFAVAL